MVSAAPWLLLGFAAMVLSHWQGCVAGVVLKRRRKSELKTGATGGKGKGFESGSLQNVQQKCHLCGKTVYPMEFLGAAGKVGASSAPARLVSPPSSRRDCRRHFTRIASDAPSVKWCSRPPITAARTTR